MSGGLAALLGAFFTASLIGMAWLVYWLVQRKRKARHAGGSSWRKSSGPSRGAQEIERLLSDAEEKLHRSPDLNRFSIRDLPVYLLVGDQGTGKTSLILNSGLQSELLAGQNRQGSPIKGTDALNIWLINRCIVIEAAARIWKDAALASVLLKKLRYPALRLIFGRRRSAPRAAIACIPADQLASGAGIETSVTPLNEFLLLVSRQLGIAIPVYAVLTRADGIPGFREIFFNLKPEEATEVLGASLDADQLADRSTYAEIAQDILTDACKKLVTFLQARRTSLLVREYELERAWSAYEFPRRLDKIRPSLVRALTNLCNPSLIQTSPVLRGFYFAGVRRTMRKEGRSSVSAPATIDGNDPMSATQIFRPGMLPAQAPRPAATAEEVDEWAFSRRLLREVIFADAEAANVSGNNRFRDSYRAALCWVAAGLAMVLICGQFVSYSYNSRLEGRLESTGAQVRQMENAPPASLLASLDKFREPVDDLVEYRESVPYKMRWGLYQGTSLFPTAQREFCTEAKRAVVDSVVKSIERQLKQGKGKTGNYDSLYRMLKAELMMSLNPEKADKDFLANELASQAALCGEIAHGTESAIEPLLRTYSALLNMQEQQTYCLVRADPEIVRQTRAYLREANADEKIYSNLLSEAGRGIAPVDYNKTHGNAAVSDSYVVSGSFTSSGWSRMQARLNEPDKLISTETWVLGEAAVAPVDKHALSGRLRIRYASEYAAEWRKYFDKATVEHYVSLDDAAKKLELITAGNQSALLWLFNLATDHTSAGEPVTGQFQPVREVAAKAGDFSTGVPYLNSLNVIKILLPNAARLSGPPRDQTFDQIRLAATQARIVVEPMAMKFRGDVGIGTRVKTLLLQPIVQVDELLGKQNATDLQAAGAGLCGPYRAIYSKFPFNPDPTAQDADLNELPGVFKPGEGGIWKYYTGSLADSLDYSSESGFTPKLNPRVPLSQNFVSFMNRVWKQNKILYATSDDPGFRLTLSIPSGGVVRSVDIDIDGQRSSLTPGKSIRINWSLQHSQQIQVQVEYISGTRREIQTYRGPWALLRWFTNAENPSTQPLNWIEKSGRAELQIGSVRMEYKLNVSLPDGTPFDLRNLKGIPCVPAAAK